MANQPGPDDPPGASASLSGWGYCPRDGERPAVSRTPGECHGFERRSVMTVATYLRIVTVDGPRRTGPGHAERGLEQQQQRDSERWWDLHVLHVREHQCVGDHRQLRVHRLVRNSKPMSSSTSVCIDKESMSVTANFDHICNIDYWRALPDWPLVFASSGDPDTPAYRRPGHRDAGGRRRPGTADAAGKWS